MLKTFSVTVGLPPSPWRVKRKVSKSDKQRRKGACLSGCQSANKSQSAANAFSSPTRLTLFKDTVVCSEEFKEVEAKPKAFMLNC